MLDKISKNLIEKVAGLHELPNGALSFRKNGKGELIRSTPSIVIEKKEDLSGINIFVKSTCQNEACHIPVVVSESGLFDVVYNDFYIEENAHVVIVAGCGVHSDTESGHNGIHTLHVGKNAHVEYIENHLATGKGKKQINPVTNIILEEGSHVVMKTTQLGGVSFSNRITNAKLKKSSILEVEEKILTDRFDVAKTNFKVDLIGENSKCKVVSKSVARDESEQIFKSNIVGKNMCFGHVECDGILLDRASIESCPKVSAKHNLASLSHEAAIGKIANDQIVKLMTLGLTEKEAEEKIIEGFLK
ncbi:MAG: SufD family Fe-S cluster assembly protein [Clostridiales bacterium]|nr:SufD family Fe-S cluster assembly protein [Clostridiales bacterium]